MHVIPHTKDIGIAIRDALELLSEGIETFNWLDPEAPSSGKRVRILSIDVSDANNPIIDTTGGCFRLRITRMD